jgi:glutamate racemase
MAVLGVFDSGLGGLTVVKDIKARFPNASVVYLGDTARVPYGSRGNDVITQFALEDVKFLSQFRPDAIIIACNTVSAVAADAVRKAVNVPVYEMIGPAARAACTTTKNGHIGVIGTRATISSHAYRTRLEGFDVYEQACPLFVPFVEEGSFASEALRLLAKEYLQPLKDAGIDTLILGCTHYPLLRNVIADVMGDEVRLISCGEAVAGELQSVPEGGRDKYFVTDLTERNKVIVENVLGSGIFLEKAIL